MTSLEALFERFRARGELAALAEIFDRTAPGLSSLGVHLVRDPVEAEDLVQATFVAAIEGAGSFQAGRRLEPWLAGILARQAARVWRRRGRALEPRVEAEPALDPSLAAEKRELAEALVLAFTRLAPREREVLRRYLDGETPLEIATSQQKSAGAVRMQVLRGLERLRRLLPSGLHAVLPLARLPRGMESVRAEVLAHAGSGAALAPAALVPVTVGALAMSTKLAAAALVVSALGFVSIRTLSEDPIPEQRPELTPALVASAPEGAIPPDPSAPTAREARVDASTAAPALESAVSAPAREGLWLAGKLVGLEGLDPKQTEIHVKAHTRSLSARGLADGTYAIDVNPLGPRSLDSALLEIHATHPAWRHVRTEVRIGDELRDRIVRGYCELSVDLDLSPRTSVVGRVAAGKPEAALVRDGVVAARSAGTDERDSTFALYPTDPGVYELRVHVPGRLLLRRAVEVAPGEIRDVGTLVLADEGAAIEGRFVRTELLGGGVAQAGSVAGNGITLTATRADLVEEEEEDSWGGSGLRTGQVRYSSTEVRSDGTFRIAGLDPGRYVLSLEERFHSGLAQLAYPERTVSAPTHGVDFGSELGLVRFGTRGAGVDPPAMLCFSYASDPLQESSRSFGRLQIADARPVEVLVDRRSEFSATVGTELALEPWRSIRAGRSALHEEVFELLPDPGLRLGSRELAWQLPEGIELTRTVRAYWQRDDDSANVEAPARTDGCRFERLEPGRYRVVVVPRSAQPSAPLPSFACARAIEVDVEAGRTTHAKVDWCLGGRARFVPEGKPRGERDALDAQVRDALGARCVATYVWLEHTTDGIRNSYGTLSLLLPSELEPNLAPGAYTLVIIDEGHELVSVPFTIIAGELVDVPVALPE
jgi:RNA polymerase sigma factor (sigma-70 family)